MPNKTVTRPAGATAIDSVPAPRISTYRYTCGARDRPPPLRHRTSVLPGPVPTVSGTDANSPGHGAAASVQVGQKPRTGHGGVQCSSRSRPISPVVAVRQHDPGAVLDGRRRRFITVLGIGVRPAPRPWTRQQSTR